MRGGPLFLSLYPFPLLEEWPLFVLLLRRWNLNSESKFARDSNSIRKRDFYIFRSKIIFALNNTIFSLFREKLFLPKQRLGGIKEKGERERYVCLFERVLARWMNKFATVTSQAQRRLFRKCVSGRDDACQNGISFDELAGYVKEIPSLFPSTRGKCCIPALCVSLSYSLFLSSSRLNFCRNLYTYLFLSLSLLL